MAEQGQRVRSPTKESGQETPVWKFAVDHSGPFESRHEAVGEAAVRSRQRDAARSAPTVWAYPECGCEISVLTLGGDSRCRNCGGHVP